MAHGGEGQTEGGLPPSTRWVAMLAVGIAVCMSVLVGSIANVALPTIAQDLHATPAQSIWVVNAYQLAVTVTLLPFASLGDVYGHRRVYCWGLLLYTIASLACAVAPTMETLVGARVLQGFGGAGIMSVNGALIRFIFPRNALGRGIGYNVLIVAGSSAAGPSVAAGIMALSSWPWLFAVQVPFGVIALLLSLRFLPYSPLAGHRFDPTSAVLNAITLGLFITGLDGIGRGQKRDHRAAGTRRVRRGRHRLRATATDPARADAAGGSVPPPGVRAFCRHRDVRPWRADDRADRPALLLPICRRPVADRNRRADHTLARGPGGNGPDRRPPGRSLLRPDCSAASDSPS